MDFLNQKLFNLVQINTSEFSRFFRTHKNIMFVGSDYKDSYTKNKWGEITNCHVLKF